MKYLEILEKCPLFRGLSQVQLENLFGEKNYSIKRYNKDALVAFRGDLYERLSIVLEGKLSAEIMDMKGKVLKVESLAAPNIVGSGILFAAENRLPVQLRAETEVVLISLSKETVLKFCARDSRIMENLLGEVGDKVNFLADKIRLYQFNTLRQKIAVYLLDQMQKQGSTFIHLPYTHDTLAELFGVSRPSLSRSLSNLVEEEILRRNGREYEINDKESLVAMVSE